MQKITRSHNFPFSSRFWLSRFHHMKKAILISVAYGEAVGSMANISGNTSTIFLMNFYKEWVYMSISEDETRHLRICLLSHSVHDDVANCAVTDSGLNYNHTQLKRITMTFFCSFVYKINPLTQTRCSNPSSCKSNLQPFSFKSFWTVWRGLTRTAPRGSGTTLTLSFANSSCPSDSLKVYVD